MAGRGPAACSVIAACTRLGVKAVAVHSEAERSARHVRLADDAVLLGPAPASESYLAVDRIVEAARRSGVAAVLPVPPALAGNARLAAAVVGRRARLGGPGRRGAGAARRRRRGAGERARLPGVGDRGRACSSPPPSRGTGPPASPGSPGRRRGRGAARRRRAGWPTSGGAAWSRWASRRTASSPRWLPGSPSTWPSWSGPTGSTPSSWPCAARPQPGGRPAVRPRGRRSSSSCGPACRRGRRAG